MPCCSQIICSRKKARALTYRKTLQNYLSRFHGHFIRQNRTFHSRVPDEFIELCVFEIATIGRSANSGYAFQCSTARRLDSDNFLIWTEPQIHLS